MRKRILGNSGIEVSEIALGSWLRYAGGVDRERKAACTRAAIDLGITLLDTANLYGQGAAETAWGEILGDYPRSRYVLATKLWGTTPNGWGSAPEQVRLQLDDSLRRLRTDYLDLYQLHRFDLAAPIVDTLGALTDAVRRARCARSAFPSERPSRSRRPWR